MFMFIYIQIVLFACFCCRLLCTHCEMKQVLITTVTFSLSEFNSAASSRIFVSNATDDNLIKA